MLPRMVPLEDEEVSKELARVYRKKGINFHGGAKVEKVEKTKSGIAVTFSVDGKQQKLEAEKILIAIGRKPWTEGLGLESVGIETDKRGFIATDHWKTSAPGVWAVGDVTLGPMLAHKAEEEAVACIETISGKAGHVNYGVIPSVIYTAPEVAWVGKTEEELKAEGRAYKAGKFPFSANSRAKINHETEGFVKILADATTDEVLGAHLIGPSVSEMVGEYCVAMEFRAASEDVARTCHPHPTRSEALRQAAMGVEGWTMQA
jgi:dihydrolipoamide dehydrogenase